MKIRQSLSAPTLIVSLGLFLLPLSGCGSESDGDAELALPEVTTPVDDGTNTDQTGDQSVAPGTDTTPDNNSGDGSSDSGNNGTPDNNGNGGNEDTPQNTDSNSGNSSTPTDPRDCTRTGFEPQQEVADTDGSNYFYRAMQGTDSLYDMLSVYSFAQWNGPSAPGTYSLDGINYKDCGLCLRMYSDCDGENCAKMYYASEGSVEISSIGAEGTLFVASMNNVVFKESTFADDFTSADVANGEIWCLEEYSFSQEFGAGVTGDVPEGDGGQ